MLHEITKIKKADGENKRWFFDSHMELTIWYSKNNQINKFQLSYDKHRNEHVLSWSDKSGYSHYHVDDGEDVVMSHKRSPIIQLNGPFEPIKIVSKFEKYSKSIDKEIKQFVIDKINGYKD